MLKAEQFKLTIRDLNDNWDSFNFDHKVQRNKNRWTKAKKIKFVKTLLETGTVMVPEIIWSKTGRKAYINVDGKQRCNTVREFMLDSFQVDGKSYSDFSASERRSFRNLPFFCRAIMNLPDDLYGVVFRNINNGTPLKPAERNRTYDSVVSRWISENADQYITNYMCRDRSTFNHLAYLAKLVAIALREEGAVLKKKDHLAHNLNLEPIFAGEYDKLFSLLKKDLEKVCSVMAQALPYRYIPQQMIAPLFYVLWDEHKVEKLTLARTKQLFNAVEVAHKTLKEDRDFILLDSTLRRPWNVWVTAPYYAEQLKELDIAA